LEEYNANQEIEKNLIKLVRKQFKRWKIGRYFVILAFFITIANIIRTAWFGRGELTGSVDGVLTYIFVIIGFSLIPFIVAMLIYAYSVCGGRDILKARLNEKVYLNDDYLINVFTPKHKQLIDADLVEYKINFYDIHELIWNADFHRLEITANFQYKMTHRFKGEKIQEKKNETVILYEYFDSMQQLMDHLEQKSNKKITGRN